MERFSSSSSTTAAAAAATTAGMHDDDDDDIENENGDDDNYDNCDVDDVVAKSFSKIIQYLEYTQKHVKSKNKTGSVVVLSENVLEFISKELSVSIDKLQQVVEFMKETATYYELSGGGGGGCARKHQLGWIEFKRFLTMQRLLDKNYDNLGFKNRFIKIQIKKQLGINGGLSLMAKENAISKMIRTLTDDDRHHQHHQQIILSSDLRVLLKLSKYLQKKVSLRRRSTIEDGHQQSTSIVVLEELHGFINNYHDFLEFCMDNLQQEVTDRAVNNLGCDERLFEPDWCKSLQRSVLEKLVQDPSGCSQRENFIYGPTQVGKTRAKKIIAWTCYATIMPCIIITKGKECATNLISKLAKAGLKVFSTCDFTERTWHKRAAQELRTGLRNGGTLVIPSK